MLWWALAAVAAIAILYAAVTALRSKDRAGAAMALVVAGAAAGGAWVYRESKFEAQSLPIYSYGVMLGLSLVVGWYLTLSLAEKDGLPKETMANCYVITALSAIFGSRILYVVTNPDEFKEFADFFALRRGGLVAYGGFLGGYLGSWIYLRLNKINLLPWADVAVPSLASGLMITRIGCYLFGCDFGTRLSEGAPGWLKKAGTFPHWAEGDGAGSPAYLHHLDKFEGPLKAEVLKTNASLPVHPTQLYESLVGLLLLMLLLWQRKHQRFRGQVFFLFAFAYGYLRFLLEVIRDDTERGEFGPGISEHWLISGSLFLFALAFAFGVSLAIKHPALRLAARVAAFVPPVVAFIKLNPGSFARRTVVELSTSQWIGLLSAIVVAFFYAQSWEAARKSPKLAMGRASLGDFEDPVVKDDSDDDEDEGDGAPKKKKRVKKKRAEGAEAEAKKASVDDSDDDDDDAREGTSEASTKADDEGDDDGDSDASKDDAEPSEVADEPDDDGSKSK